MFDLLLMVTAVSFFALTLAFVAYCRRLAQSGGGQ